LGAALLYEGQPGWEEILTAVSDDAVAAGDLELSCTAAYHLASGLGFVGRIDEGTALSERQSERAAQWGLATWVTHFEATILINRALMGGRAEWLHYAAQAFLAAHPIFRNRFHAHTALILALCDLGRVDDARRHVDVASGDARSAEAELFAAIAAAEIAWYQSDLTAARAAAERARQHGDTWFGVRVLAELVALHVAVEQDEPFAVQLPSVVLPNLWAGLHDIAGLEAWQAGDTATALAELDRAAAGWQAVSSSHFAVRSAAAAAMLAQRSGRRDAATRRAHAIDLARRGGHGGILEKLGAARTDGLTPREESVMLLVAGGRTTGEVAAELGISAATVESHVRAACRKLGAGGRREAALHVAAAQ
jgi:DNA-binding CsgD family transcriptional regulator